MTKVIINGVEHGYCFGYGAMLEFERRTGRDFSIDKSATTAVNVHYSCFKKGGSTMTFDEVTRALDNPATRQMLDTILTEQINEWGIIPANTQGADEVEKKR